MGQTLGFNLTTTLSYSYTLKNFIMVKLLNRVFTISSEELKNFKEHITLRVS